MITFQHPRDAAWFPVVQLPAGWKICNWDDGEITIIAPDSRSIINIDPWVPA